MIIKADEELVTLQACGSFTVVGDPGCDGLGAENMDVLAAALDVAEGDFIVLAGDVVPFGTEHFYATLNDVVRVSTDKPVLVLCGNHDREDYVRRFGLSNYIVACDGFDLIFLDNSSRCFTDETLSFLSRALDTLDSHRLVILFHIPPPNLITGNSMDDGDWERFLRTIGPHRARIDRLVAGHVHAYFEDAVDGMTLVATGGGGARVEHVDRVRPIPHHVVEFSIGPDGHIRHERRDLSPGGHGGEKSEIRRILMQTFTEECAAHVGYLLSAEDAERRGLVNLAHLFRAAADSELRHARNVKHVMSRTPDPTEAVEAALAAERTETEQTYRDRLELTIREDDMLSSLVFRNALAAEKVHMDLFGKALMELDDGGDIAPARYHTCASCGMTFVGDEPPKHCPACGAPADQIREAT